MLLLHGRGKHNQTLKNSWGVSGFVPIHLGRWRASRWNVKIRKTETKENTLRRCRKTNIMVKIVVSEYTCYITGKKFKKLLLELDKAHLSKLWPLKQNLPTFCGTVVIFGISLRGNIMVVLGGYLLWCSFHGKSQCVLRFS